MIALILLLLLIYLVLLSLGYLLFPHDLLVYVCIFVSMALAVSLYLCDKLLLLVLKAREIVDGKNVVFLQKVKHLSFKYGIKTPKVYVYKGKVSRIFTLYSRGEISLVFESGLVKTLEDDELDALIVYMLSMYKVGGGTKRTICYLVSSLCMKFLYGSNRFLFYFVKNIEMRKSLLFVIGLFIKPIIEFMFKASFNSREVKRINSFLKEELKESHNFKAALTKLSYRRINKDLLGNTLMNFVSKDEVSESKYLDIFEVFPGIDINITT